MSKGQIVLMVIWSILAMASFVACFWMPELMFKIITFAFGVFNCGITLSFGVLLRDYFKRKK